MNVPRTPEATLGVLRNQWGLFDAWRKAKAVRTVVVEIDSGLCLGVHGLPAGWSQRVIDWDNLAEDENRTELEQEAKEAIKRALAQNKS